MYICTVEVMIVDSIVNERTTSFQISCTRHSVRSNVSKFSVHVDATSKQHFIKSPSRKCFHDITVKWGIPKLTSTACCGE